MISEQRSAERGLRSFTFGKLLWYFATIALLLSSQAAESADTGGMRYQGVNISGAEFHPTQLPGWYGIDYLYPQNSEIDYFATKGMNVIRVPFTWERMQPTKNQPLNADELKRLDRVVAYATSKGMSVILDLHNYGVYRKQVVGTPNGLANTSFAYFWTQLASHYAQEPKVIFGLMNEPGGAGMTAVTWKISAETAINAIRATGAKNLILVSAPYWDHPSTFVARSAKAMILLKDPANNFSFEVHQYVDRDGSGTHPGFRPVNACLAPFSALTKWLSAHHRTAFLGEIGVTSAPGALADLSAILRYMHAHPNSWTGFTYWTAGSWYDADYMFSIEPFDGKDRAQMLTIQSLLGKQR